MKINIPFCRTIYQLSLLLLLGVTILPGQDAREKSHSIDIIPYQDEGNQKYYLTWASSSGSRNYNWQHDIYKQLFYFDDFGNLNSESAPLRFIGDGYDEAQEPVSAALNGAEMIILSAWEDGSGSSVDIRGQLHKPDGVIVRDNWAIAAGEESQHSATVAHLHNSFIVAFTDEAPPAQTSMTEVRILDDREGSLLHSLNLSPSAENHWWPVIASDNQSRALVCWGNGSELSGSVIQADSATATYTSQSFYLSGIEQYYYSVAWLQKLNCFIAVAKAENSGIICLVDTNGTRYNFANIPGAAITRETSLAVAWDDSTDMYTIIYPSSERNIILLDVSESEIKLNKVVLGNSHNALKDITWPTTGIVSQIVNSENNHNLWQTRKLVYFAYNDSLSNHVIHLPVKLTTETTVTEGQTTEIPKQSRLFQAYPNPFNPSTRLSYFLSRTCHVRLKVYSLLGQEIITLVDGIKIAGEHMVVFNAQGLPAGIYYYSLAAADFIETKKIVMVH